MTAKDDNAGSVQLPAEITAHLDGLREIAAKYAVRSVAVVGSAAHGCFTPAQSDLDLLVDFGEFQPGLAKRALGFQRDAEALFGRRVDVLSVHGIRAAHWRAIHDATKVPVYAAA
jgi:predicted nucleotidyltransferase